MDGCRTELLQRYITIKRVGCRAFRCIYRVYLVQTLLGNTSGLPYQLSHASLWLSLRHSQSQCLTLWMVGTEQLCKSHSHWWCLDWVDSTLDVAAVKRYILKSHFTAIQTTSELRAFFILFHRRCLLCFIRERERQHWMFKLQLGLYRGCSLLQYGWVITASVPCWIGLSYFDYSPCRRSRFTRSKSYCLTFHLSWLDWASLFNSDACVMKTWPNLGSLSNHSCCLNSLVFVSIDG